MSCVCGPWDSYSPQFTQHSEKTVNCCQKGAVQEDFAHTGSVIPCKRAPAVKLGHLFLAESIATALSILN